MTTSLPMMQIALPEPVHEENVSRNCGIVENSTRFLQVGRRNISAEFETRKDAWGMISIPFSSFVPRYRGQRLDGPALDPGRITGMGLMIYDNQDGPFELRLASVQAYAADAPFTLLQYQWKKRVLVVSAGTANDENLRKQQNDLASTLEEFADRDMVLVTLLDDAVSTADGRELTTEDAMAAREALGIRSGSFTLRLIGKDGSVKLLRDTAIPMTQIYALIDSMPMRRREKSERTSSKDRT